MNLEHQEFTTELTLNNIEDTDKLLPVYQRENQSNGISLIIEEKENDIRSYYNFIPCHDQLGNDLFRMNFNDQQKLLITAYNIKKCQAVNTQGYLKTHINRLQKIQGWSYYGYESDKNDGIYIKKKILQTCETSNDIISLNPSILQNKKIGMDIGASTGDTLHLFKDCDIIYAFEPHPQDFGTLQKNIINKNVIAYDYAIYDTNGILTFNMCNHQGYSSLLEFDPSGELFHHCDKIDKGFNEAWKINIKTKRLDSFIEENYIENIDFIKIDTQGTDFKVVKSLGKYIKNVRKIELEVQLKSLYKNSSNKDEIIKFMTENNFSIDSIMPNSAATKDYEERITFINNIPQIYS